MLLDELFANLLDLHLQKQIAECFDLDSDATEALSFLLEQDLTILQNDLKDWTMEKVEGNNMSFYKAKNYIPRDVTL